MRRACRSVLSRVVSRRSIVSHRCFSEAPKKLIIPPNLTIDPRSSFLNRPVVDDSDYEDDDRDDEIVEDENVLDYQTADPEQRQIMDELLESVNEEAALVLQPEPVQYAIPLPERLHVNVHSLFAPMENNVNGTIWLNENVFGMDPIRVDLIKKYIVYFRAKKRGMRTACTKTISQVSGSNRKVRKQKGTGRARAGHSRPPHWRGGAKAHGPKNTTNYGNHKLNIKVRKMAMRHALSQKLKEQNLVIFDHFDGLPTHKTKELAKLLKPWNVGKHVHSCFFADHYLEPDKHLGGLPVNFKIASKNIPNIAAHHTNHLNIYNILYHDKIFMSLAALEEMERRLKDE